MEWTKDSVNDFFEQIEKRGVPYCTMFQDHDFDFERARIIMRDTINPISHYLKGHLTVEERVWKGISVPV